MKEIPLHRLAACFTLALVSILALSPGTFAADDNKEVPDFKASSFRITIHRYTPATAAEMAKHAAKPIKVQVEEDCTIEDFAKVCDHAWIEELSVEFTEPASDALAAVAKLTALRDLKVRESDQARDASIDLAPLAGLSALESLDFYGTRVNNTDALKALTKLKEVSFYMSGIESIEFLRNTPEVEELNLYGTKHSFADYQPVLALPRLVKLNVYMNPQATDKNLAALAQVTTLEEFHMSNCKKVTTLGFLSGSKGLKKLHANWCDGLTDLSALHDMSAMETLDIWDLPSTDLSFLSKMPELTYLNLKGIKIDDLSILAGLKKLKSLSLEADTVPADAEAQLKTLLPDTRLSIR